MGIYNCAATIDESIDSILAQTFSDWELIMCDDCSADDTLHKAKAYQSRYPERIIVVGNERNMGLNFTLNKCFSYATGEFIGRQDGDDISDATRFSVLFDFLTANKQFDIVSSAMIHFDAFGEWGVSRMKEFPTKNDFVRGTPFCHAASLFTRKSFESVGGYTQSPYLLRVEDYDLWSKMYKQGFYGANLQVPLYKMRDDREAFNRRKFRYRINETYAMILTFKRLNLPFRRILNVFRPLLVGLLPAAIYDRLHKQKLRKRNLV